MKKHLALFASISALTIASASAEELSSIKTSPQGTPTSAWDGVYVGMNAGYGWGLSPNVWTQGYGFDQEVYRTTASSSYGTSTLGLANSGNAVVNQQGFIGGGQVGYNHLFKNYYLIGAEADIQATNIGDTGTYAGSGITPGWNSFGRTITFRGTTVTVNSPHGGAITETGSRDVQTGVNWLGTVRGRAGYLVTPTLLGYVTGGIAYGGVYGRNNSNYLSQKWTDPEYRSAPLVPLGNGLNYSQVEVGSAQASNTLVGWTLGGGGEWMFSPQWSLKGEALYYDLGRFTYAGSAYSPSPEGNNFSALVVATQTNVRYNGIITRMGLNYHVNLDEVRNSILNVTAEQNNPHLPHDPQVTSNWTGMYIGMNAGYGWGSHAVYTAAYGGDPRNSDLYKPTNGSNNYPQPGGLSLASSGWTSINQNGFIGGMQIGYNYQYGSSIIVGAETDIQGSTVKGSGTYAGPPVTTLVNRFTDSGRYLDQYQTARFAGSGQIQAGLNYLGTVRARVGYLINSKLLAYATSGLGYGDAYAQTNFSSRAIQYERSVTPATYGQETVQYDQLIGGKGNVTGTLLGWVVGGGLEWMFMPDWTLKTEGIYYDLGSLNLSGFGFSPTARGDSSNSGIEAATWKLIDTSAEVRYSGIIARAGVNYHFKFDPTNTIVNY